MGRSSADEGSIVGPSAPSGNSVSKLKKNDASLAFRYPRADNKKRQAALMGS